MPSFTYVARRPGPFSALVQAAEIGGLRLSPLPPVRVLDRFFDTADGELLRQGLALRVREQGGDRVAGVRLLEGDRMPPDDVALDPRLEVDGTTLDLPDGPLAEAVHRLVGDDPLRPLLSLRQYRTPRVAHEGATPAGVVSFDVVVYDVPGGRVVSNEVEVEPDPAGGSLAELDAVLGEHGLELVTRSKFERAVLRARRPLSEPALLLPDERRQLDAAVAGEGPSARVAQAVLLDSRGFRPDTIATQTGLGMARVKQIRERFREVRLDVLAPVPAPAPRRPSPAPAAPRPAAPSPEVHLSPLPESGGRHGDGLAFDRQPESMDDLLDLFQTEAPDTPLFADVDDEDTGDVLAPEPVRTSTTRRRYPVVLGPVATSGRALRSQSSFSDVDLASFRSPRPSRSSTASQAAPRSSTSAGVLRGETPLLAAAHIVVTQRIEAFDAAVAEFLDTRAPSAARRLVVAAHGLRLSLDTFEPALPMQTGRRLVEALRPLVVDLDAALDYGRAALAGSGTRGDVSSFLAQRAVWALDTAASRLRHSRQRDWRERADRLLRQMADDAKAGRARSDGAPPAPEDYVGAPGDGPLPTQLRHLLGSELWRRFEAVRALGGDLEEPTPEFARRLSVALGGLRASVDLVGQVVDEASSDVRHVASALRAAERAVSKARQRVITAVLTGAAASDQSMGVVPDVWEAIAARSFRARLAAIAEAI